MYKALGQYNLQYTSRDKFAVGYRYSLLIQSPEYQMNVQDAVQST